MNEHALAWVFGALAGIVTAAAFATRVQVLPDVDRRLDHPLEALVS